MPVCPNCKHLFPLTKPEWVNIIKRYTELTKEGLCQVVGCKIDPIYKSDIKHIWKYKELLDIVSDKRNVMCAILGITKRNNFDSIIEELEKVTKRRRI